MMRQKKKKNFNIGIRQKKVGMIQFSHSPSPQPSRSPQIYSYKEVSAGCSANFHKNNYSVLEFEKNKIFYTI